VANKQPPYDFESKFQQISGFNYDEKLKIFEILITFGVPVTYTDGELKEDWYLLKALIDKSLFGNEKLPMITSEQVS